MRCLGCGVRCGRTGYARCTRLRSACSKFDWKSKGCRLRTERKTLRNDWRGGRWDEDGSSGRSGWFQLLGSNSHIYSPCPRAVSHWSVLLGLDLRLGVAAIPITTRDNSFDWWSSWYLGFHTCFSSLSSDTCTLFIIHADHQTDVPCPVDILFIGWL